MNNNEQTIIDVFSACSNFEQLKKAWCFHVDDWNRKKKHKLTLDEIRNLHSSIKLHQRKTDLFIKG